jgi:hypothetical protein
MSGNLETNIPYIVLLRGKESWLAIGHLWKSVGDSCKLCILGVVTMDRYNEADRILCVNHVVAP